MIGFAMEVPTAYMERERASGWTDLDFALAHKVLADPQYAGILANRPTSRELILDNSMHELGAPLPMSQVKAAAEIVRADYVIVPDWLEDPERSLDAIFVANEKLRPFKLAVNLVGDDDISRRRVLEAALLHGDMLCLPYRRPRLEWFLSMGKAHQRGVRIHLLGMSSLAELVAWMRIATAFPSTRFTVDTSKPFKWGLEHRRIDDGHDLRHNRLRSVDLLEVKTITPAQLTSIEYNVRFLRRVLAGHVNDTAFA